MTEGFGRFASHPGASARDAQALADLPSLTLQPCKGTLRRRMDAVPGKTAMVLAHLHRIDPEANIARFYSIDVSPSLFGEVSVLRSWSRIETKGNQTSAQRPLARWHARG